MRGALSSAAQKRRRSRGYRPRSLRPRRVFIPEWGELEALASVPGWAGPTLEEVAAGARRFGWAAATAATLEVEWRQHQTKLVPHKPKALSRTIALCYAGRCPAPERHSGECGPVAQRLHTARRADDLDYRRRAIDAKHWQPSADPGQDNSQWWDTPPQPQPTVEAPTDELAPLDADYYRLELVPYLIETGADEATYETWGVPVEYRPAPR